MILRWNRLANLPVDLRAGAANLGEVKGATFDRVLIFPTKAMLKYLRTADINDTGGRDHFYVAATRAKFSVAFVVPDARIPSTIATPWPPKCS